MAEKVILELTRVHAQIVQDACEMLMRMRLGQAAYPVELMLGWPKHEGMSSEEYCIRRDIADEIMRAFLTAVLGTNKYGQPDGKKDEVEALAYEVWGTIRHEMWKHENGDRDSWDVRSQAPLSESGLKMPKCTVEDI